MKIKAVLAVVVAGALAQLANVACGPACLDDRCSLKPAQPQTTVVDYTGKKQANVVGGSPVGSGAPVGPGPGSAAPPNPGSGAPVKPPPVGSGSGSGSAIAGSGSAVPPPVTNPVEGANWELWAQDSFKMHVISKGTYPANTTLKFELVKTPTKTPFVVQLLVKPAGGQATAEGVWNDCPEGKIKCDGGGTKSHSTKKAGQIMLQGGINWTVTGVTDEAKGALVTWTNNLSREVLQVRLLK
jgi:hypothetical protein